MDLDANQTYITTNSVNFSNCPIGVTEGVALRSGSSVNVSGMKAWLLDISIGQLVALDQCNESIPKFSVQHET